VAWRKFGDYMIKKALTLSLCATIIAQGICYAAAPSRVYNYTAGSTIISSQVNSNETALYIYLQNGVDTYLSGSITNNAVSASASIQYSKLNLTGQILNADISSSTTLDYSKLNLTGQIINSDISSDATIDDTKLAPITTSGKVNTSAITGTLGISNGGTGQITAQAAIDSLTAVSAATNEHVLTKDTTTGNAIFKVIPTQAIKTFFSGSFINSSGNYNFLPLNSSIGETSDQIYARSYIPVSGTFKNLYVVSSSSGGLTIYKNGSATTLTATTGTLDSTHSFTVVAGDYVQIHADNTNQTYSYVLEFDPS